MFVVHDQQMHVLCEARERALKARLFDRLAHDYPEDHAALGDEGARALVSESMRLGRGRGIRSEAAFEGLLRVHVEFGLGLERAPYRGWANGILDHPTLPGDLKVNMVSKRLAELTQGRRVVLHREEG